MFQAVLQFPNIQELWGFKEKIFATSIEVNVRELKLFCRCTDADLEMAKTEFKAEIIEATKIITYL
jgi:hypothetical protein